MSLLSKANQLLTISNRWGVIHNKAVTVDRFV